MSPAPHVRIEALADDAWLLTLGDAIEPALLARVHARVDDLRATAPAGILDLVPAYASIGVFFDPRQLGAGEVRAWLQARLDSDARQRREGGGACIEVPVAYGGEFGPDLADAARELGLDAEKLASRHAAAEYTVAMIGFAPGFPYLAGLDPALALARLATPRTHIPAGSVAIGGAQTGIYPRESPGGWRLLGRTPLALFDPGRGSPALLQPGDRVRFRPIDADAFARLGEAPA